VKIVDPPPLTDGEFGVQSRALTSLGADSGTGSATNSDCEIEKPAVRTFDGRSKPNWFWGAVSAIILTWMFG